MDVCSMRLLVAALALLASITAAGAVDFSSPRAVVEALYAPYFQPTDGFDYSLLDDDPYISTRLKALYLKDQEEAAGDIGRIDFDPYINGQDFQVSDLSVSDPVYAGGKALVHATFKNFESAQDMGYLLVNEGGAWKIDNMWAGESEYPYDLLDLLQAPLQR
jgi:hypothetical protein